LIAIDMLSSPMQSATPPAELLEKFGPHELASVACKLSARAPVEQAPSVIAELPVAVAAYALGITCTAGASSAIAVTATTAKAATIIFLIVFVAIISTIERLSIAY
jgi:hypothetical protein